MLETFRGPEGRGRESGCNARAGGASGGFTILEIMIATAILTLGLVSVLALFPVAIHTGKKVVDTSTAAVIAEFAPRLDAAELAAAKAAAAVMAMNNVYYRFLHLSGDESYSKLPARLRMNRLASPAAGKLDFELYSLAVSAVNGCETCVQAHEQVLIKGGLSETQVHDAVRIAAVVNAAACARLAATGATEAAAA